MKLSICLFALFVSLALGGLSQPAEHPSQLAGIYCWSVPGSTWTLTLRASGDYDLTTRGSVPGSVEEPIEAGRWVFEGLAVVLKSDKALVGGSDYRHLYVLRKKSDRLMLVSALRAESYTGGPFGRDTLFDFVFLRFDDPARIPAEPDVISQRL